MANNLTQSQKDILEDVYQSDNSIHLWIDIPEEQRDAIEQISGYTTLKQEAETWLVDRFREDHS